MIDETDDENELSIYLANEVVSLANAKMDAGLDPQTIASALNHAAANFTAFINADADGAKSTAILQKEFSNLLEYYIELHQDKSSEE